MPQSSKTKILAYIEQHQQATVKELVDVLGISKQLVHRHLKTFVEQGLLSKRGKAPKVLYVLDHQAISLEQSADVLVDIQQTIDKRYLYVTVDGRIVYGMNGFSEWCQKTHQPVEKTAREYIATLAKYDAFRKNGLIDGTEKLRSTFPIVYIDTLYYLDFYSIERFGKTKLGQLLLYAKQSQNTQLITALIKSIQPQVHQLIQQENIDAVGFIPPTVKREVQLMFMLETHLQLTQEVVHFMKITSDVAIPQKSLSTLQDRIENARKTIYVTEKKTFHTILLIDDAVGSGATLNETAYKIRQRGLCTGKIIGLALTGSFKGFDVISEV